MSYKSTHTGEQIDSGVSAALNPDATPTLSSTNLVTSGGVAAKLSEKQDTLVFDNAPTSGSNNPVKSGGIYTADAALEQMILASFPTDSITNAAVASFNDGADGIPVKALTVNITPVQSGSGDPSPTNVRPISGWTGANIYRGGENLLDGVGVAQGNLTSTGGTQSSNKRVRTPFVAAAASTAYSVALGAGFIVIGAYFYATDNTDSFILRETSDSGLSSFTTPATAAYVRFVFARIDTDVNITPEELTEQRLVCVSSGYTFINLPFPTPPGTVYGGTLTDNGDGTWTLTVTWAWVDLAALTWTPDAEHGTFLSSNLRTGSTYKYIQQINTSMSASVVARVEKYNPISLNEMTASYPDNSFAITTTGNIVVKADVSPSGFLAYQIKNGQPLPEYTLTAESVKTLLGSNNIFADCGDVNTLTYRADVGLYIDKKIAEA